MATFAVAKTATDALHAKLSALSVGYQPIPSHSEIYESLLRRIAMGIYEMEHDGVDVDETNNQPCKKRNFTRRQSPLVNAGYTARIAIVSAALQNFITSHSPTEFHDGDERKKVNIFMLGGGMDAIGIWALKLAKENHLDAHLFEFDCRENCVAKREALKRTDVLRESHCDVARQCNVPRGDDNVIIASGYVGVDNVKSEDSKYAQSSTCEEKSNYTLVQTNLKDVNSVKFALSQSKMACSLPTIIISELVLAYLGKTCVDDLLELLSSEFHSVPGCMLVAYEPMGSSTPLLSSSTPIKTYVNDYCDKFTEKLTRGNASSKKENGKHSNTSSPNEEDNCFTTLGSNCDSIEQRFKSWGWCHTLALSAGKAAASIPTAKICLSCAPELFDEYAALSLHLQCYVLACGISQSTTKSMADQLLGFSTARRRLQPKTQNILNPSVDISSIDIMEHEQQVRGLYHDIYAPFFDDFPSIRKLVKSALKNDFGGKKKVKDPISKTLMEEDESLQDADVNISTSSVRNKFIRWGGDFWVATIPNNNKKDRIDSNDEKLSDENDASLNTRQRKVVGCIGIRSSGFTEDTIRGSTTTATSIESFEIHRLAVDSTYQGMGIGRALLKTAEEFAVQKSTSHNMCCTSLKLVATTPAVMHAANQLYSSCGFDMSEEKVVGGGNRNEMVMRTFVKEKKVAS